MPESIVKPAVQVMQAMQAMQPIEPREPEAYPKHPKRPAGARRPMYLAAEEDSEA